MLHTEQNYVETRGPKSFEEDKKRLVRLLKSIQAGDATLTNYMKQALVKAGYCVAEIPPISNRGRGRPAEIVTLTGKAKALINLSVNWHMEK